ncbi:FAD-binding oxidoreductase [Streptomyces sp. NBC_01235]|uniref:FAD-binding oxidoreductase n=1 Tax=Streptomyces sp. NBC_01235 TaxID=2903788 RepID=UPI002E1452F5|nr:FAD-binding oxidoreductase [Streptomyces sp. NBC_01235]
MTSTATPAPASRILPPGLDEKQFAEAIVRFREVVGEEHVISEPASLAAFHDPYPVGAEPAGGASAVACPADTAQVQAVVRIANEYGIPLSPISTGKNNGYGGAAPRLTGSVVVDTGARMRRILEVNERFGYALLEPGVTYFQLYEHLQTTGSGLMLDCPDLGWGSVVGNTLDRGVGYTPYGDHFMWQTGLEVVLPEGDVLRTGMGAVPGSNSWQLFPYGFGPYPDGMFTQSNLGIVTKMGIALMQRPPASMSYLITFEHEDDLARIVDIMLPLRINMAPLQNVPVLRNIVLDAGVVSQRTEWYDGDGPLPAEAIERMKRELNLGYWNFYGTLYGPPPVIDTYYGMIKDAFGQIPGARFHTHEERPEAGDRGAHALHDRHKINNGIPSLDELKLLDWIPNGGHLAFSPVSAPDGEDALKQFRMVRRRTDEWGTDYAAQFIIGLREMHHIGLFLYDTHDPKSRQETLDLTRLLIREAAAEGYGEYRTHNALMDDVMATYNWGDGALLKFHERVKDALDPRGVIAPGKSGIWPERFRGQSH